MFIGSKETQQAVGQRLVEAMVHSSRAIESCDVIRPLFKQINSEFEKAAAALELAHKNISKIYDIAAPEIYNG